MPLATVDGIQFREREFTLQPGDTVFVYTDGATDAVNRDKTLFGDALLTETVNEYKDNSPKDLVLNVRAAIDGFAGDEFQFDDITLLVFKYNGPDPDNTAG